MNKMILAVLVSGLAVAGARADAAYSLVNDKAGYSYIQINQDVSDFSFFSDFKSIGNSGKVGFFVYPDGLTGDKLKDYIAKNPADDAKFGKHVDGGRVDLGELKEGDRVGFYLERNNGHLVRGWSFETDHKGVTYIAFDKNGGKGKDEWMSIADIKTTSVPGGEGGTPSGQPLPGLVAMLALGGAGLGAYKFKKRS